ncbi:ABC-F family ATP-binding cassette domain-containing protein [Lachnospira pectinoschiza]|uniref:ATP-binding cassette, subfamily F, member 3 n=1 Tax=Lachnospira pectinoschiza TaxID=28052 RepID=A0A1G9YAT7_9FIRM|nr:ABC-F family ATP-binding cassette domain-containing protein [Lachnospira pectinoschiza]SDN05641.1 ATP-binding cassette, subfamily F, member 3 [Lachnospira pectinoschiza]
MILSVNNLSKSFATDVIIKDCTFNIEDHEKAAIIGINGAGKSTLLKMIVGEEPLDSGLVTLSKGKTLAYLAQQQELNSGKSIYDELLEVKQYVIDMETELRDIESRMGSTKGEELDALLNKYNSLNQKFEMANGYAYKSEIVGVLKGLGFSEEDFSLNVNTLSGGQKTRVALGKILLSSPDIILLDEPTNHLDMESIAWLENYLLNYNGAVVLVSHDRYFLDKIVSKVIEIDQGNVTTFSGNYTDYAAKKAVLRNMKLKEYLNQQRDIKHQEAVITKLKQFNREKSIKRAESREKMLDKMEVIDKPTEIDDKMKIKLEPEVISGNDVLTIEGLTKSFDDVTLFKDLNLEIKRGERVALIGNNGTGKTTILRLINGLIPADSGTIMLGSKVEIGYYDQEHHVLDPDKTLFEEISDAYPDLNNTKIRNTLAAFLFTGDDVFKYIRDLSGGERGRVSLAKLMLSNANLLILDEPTNHLDIVSKEILENALNSYTGTVLYVSHDRYFINTTATRIVELTNKTTVNYIGNYDYYLEKKDILTAAAVDEALKNDPSLLDSPKQATVTASTSNSNTNSKEEWKLSREEQNRLKKAKNELKKVEAKIEELEEKIKKLDEEYADPSIASNTARLMEIHKEKSSVEADLNDLYEKWETLSESI